jgi:hypothetical protein
MAVSKCASKRAFNKSVSIELKVKSEPIDQVSDFVFLGATVSGDGTIDKENSESKWSLSILEDLEQQNNKDSYKDTDLQSCYIITILLYG